MVKVFPLDGTCTCSRQLKTFHLSSKRLLVGSPQASNLYVLVKVTCGSMARPAIISHESRREWTLKCLGRYGRTALSG